MLLLAFTALLVLAAVVAGFLAGVKLAELTRAIKDAVLKK